MEIEPALPNPPSSLSRRLSVVAARRHGVGPEQLPLIGVDPNISKILADAEMIYGARAAGYPQVPDPTVFRETADLNSGIVGSIH